MVPLAPAARVERERLTHLWFGPLRAAVRGLGTEHREAGADAVLLVLDRDAGSTSWWGQLPEGRSQRPRRVGEDCEISLWASWSATEPSGENVLLGCESN